MFKFIQILLWIDCIILSRDHKSNKLGEGSFFGPPVSRTSKKPKSLKGPLWSLFWDLRKHENHRPSSETLCNKLDVMYQILFIHSIMIRLHKPLKRSLQSPNPPKGPFFGPCLWDLRKHENHRPSNVRVFVTNLMLCIQFYSYILLWVDCINL